MLTAKQLEMSAIGLLLSITAGIRFMDHNVSRKSVAGQADEMTGRVLDGSSGRPLTGANVIVRLYPRRDSDSLLLQQSVDTDEAGCFRVLLSRQTVSGGPDGGEATSNPISWASCRAEVEVLSESAQLAVRADFGVLESSNLGDLRAKALRVVPFAAKDEEDRPLQNAVAYAGMTSRFVSESTDRSGKGLLKIPEGVSSCLVLAPGRAMTIMHVDGTAVCAKMDAAAVLEIDSRLPFDEVCLVGSVDVFEGDSYDNIKWARQRLCVGSWVRAAGGETCFSPDLTNNKVIINDVVAGVPLHVAVR